MSPTTADPSSRLPEVEWAARLPRGFRAAATTAGVKTSGRPDLSVVLVDGGDGAVAATFTPNRFASAPVLLAREMARHTPAMPGAVAAVRAVAAAGLPVAVASNSSREELAAKLRGLGLAQVFGARVFSFQDVERPKPWPDIYLAAAAACDAAPGDCVVIEDSVPGVRAGKAAGCRVLGFAHETPGAVLAAHGAEPFAAMEELPGLLGL